MSVFKDISGQTFRGLFVEKLLFINKYGSQWQCRCVCGDIRTCSTTFLKINKPRKCGTCLRNKYREYINKKIKKWTVISLKSEGKCIIFNCQCECGRFSDIKSNVLIANKTNSCKNCAKRSYVGKITPHILRQIFKGAKLRDLDINIDPYFIWNLFKNQGEKCALSGLPIDFADTAYEHSHGVTTASLDRIDSDLGYLKNNVQWVHKDINFMKQDFNEDYFIYMCSLISYYHKKIYTENMDKDWKYWRSS